MPAVQCPNCDSHDIDAVGKTPAGDLQLKCDDCGTEWTRTPNRPCPKCAAIDVTHTDAAGYLCRGCGHSWRDIPMAPPEPVPVKATRARAVKSTAAKSAATVATVAATEAGRPVLGGAAHRVGAVWEKLETHAGEPFTLKSGQQFSYQVSADVLMPTSANWDVPKGEFAEALRRMPIAGPAQLKDLQAAAFIFALLQDVRIAPAWQ
ncbi:MAG: hypothetical protein ABI912_00080 [Actinomycetota bacterium]